MLILFPHNNLSMGWVEFEYRGEPFVLLREPLSLFQSFVSDESYTFNRPKLFRPGDLRLVNLFLSVIV